MQSNWRWRGHHPGKVGVLGGDSEGWGALLGGAGGGSLHPRLLLSFQDWRGEAVSAPHLGPGAGCGGGWGLALSAGTQGFRARSGGAGGAGQSDLRAFC